MAIGKVNQALNHLLTGSSGSEVLTSYQFIVSLERGIEDPTPPSHYDDQGFVKRTRRRWINSHE
jgi:hypothetical protein